MQIQPIMVGGAKPISGQGRGPKPEAQRAERGRVLGGGRGSQPPPNQLGSPGSAVSSLSGKVSLHSRGATRPLLELVEGQVRGRGHCPLAPPKSAYVSSVSSSLRPIVQRICRNRHYSESIMLLYCKYYCFIFPKQLFQRL